MLTALRIKNLALVTDLTLELQPGYNVITGETGAGKSILIGALSLVLGERADRTLLRAGCDNCSVEAVFDVAHVHAAQPTAILPRPEMKARGEGGGEGRFALESFLDENGLEPCEAGQLVLKRVFTASGSNRQFVNGSPTTLSVLAALGEWLVDIHGPHDHQSLLHPAKQLAILDAYGGLQRDREAFGERVRRRAALEAEKAALIVDEKAYAQQLDLLRFQVKEIETACLEPDEDQQVESAYQRASNGAKLAQLTRTALDLLGENESSVLSQAGRIGRALQELQRVDAGAAPLAELHAQAVSVLGELQAELSRYAGKVDLDPAQLLQLEERLNLIHALKRKYGASLAKVLDFGEGARRRLHDLEQRDVELARLNAELAKLDAELRRAGGELSGKRRKVIPRLAKAVGRELADLGFKQSKFDVAIVSDFVIDDLRSGIPLSRPLATLPPSAGERDGVTGHSFSATGLDAIEFQFAPNPGEAARPLRAIASSGEMARVMLALKTVLAAEDEIPVLVFDEVDANIGGETAHAVGGKMRGIAAKRQVLCVTHLPQVAAPAEAHYVVTKQVKDGRTISEIARIGQAERVVELTRMLGGQGDAARKHAEAMLATGARS